MLRPFARYLGITVILALSVRAVLADQPQGDVAEVVERATKAAVAKVAPSIVQIETSGGTDVVGAGAGSPLLRRGTGPTTGVVLSTDGYVISSSFNFANKPAAIFVSVPGHKDRYVARVVAEDHTRMVTLLKIDAKSLPVPAAAPKKEIRVGQWALACGRTWSGLDTPPSVSIGIVSALGRIWGKAIQTDAKVSPVNYGGPLVDLEGRVLGILVPASPRGQDETAGVEWYDSGIGFAIPLEDINRVLPRLKKGDELRKGVLGITLQSADIYATAPAIASVAPDSAAAKAGIKPGDVVTAINGKPVVRQAQILHFLGEKYEGDVVAVNVRRDKKELHFDNLKLSGNASVEQHSFLGILPIRDDPLPGEEVRYVFPKGPAAAAGLKAGDRIVKIGLGGMPPRPFLGRDRLTRILDRLPPGTVLNLEVLRGKKTEKIKVTLGTLTGEVPDRVPEKATAGKALARRPTPGTPPAPPALPKPKAKPEKKAETGLLKRTTQARDHEYWLYVPKDYDPNISYALVVWLHPEGKNKDRITQELIDAWEDFCSDSHIILLCPRAENPNGWLGSESDFVLHTIQDVEGEYTIDRQRIIAHGMGVGGQMAFYLGFHAPDVIHGVATTGAAFTTAVRDNPSNARLAFFVVAGGKDPRLATIRESKDKLAARKLPLVYHESPEMGHQYLDAVMLHELIAWIDALDRQ